MVIARVGGSIGCAGIGVFDGQVAQRVGDGCVLQAGNGDDVAGFGALHRHARKAAEGQQLGDAGALDHLAVAVQRLDLAVGGDGAGFDAARQDAAEIIVGLQRRHQHLEGMLVARQRHAAWACGTSSTMQLEQRRQILALVFQFVHRPAVAARGVEMMEVELVVIGFQRQEQVEDRFQRLLGLGVGAVDLVDDDDGLQAQLQRLGQHELGLRHDAISAASTSSTTPSTIDRMRSTSPPKSAWPGVSTMLMRVPCHSTRGAFGQDGDAALALLIVGIHGALGHVLVLAHRAGLLQQLVDQRGLAMVDMGDDGDVADIHGLDARGGSAGL